jgi:uncharacterized protein
MQQRDNQILYSPTDLCNHLECPHWTILAITDLQSPLPKDEHDEESILVWAKGERHEKDYFEKLILAGRKVRDLRREGKKTREQMFQDTCAAMAAGEEIIYQAFLTNEQFTGYADFLIRVERPSKLGSYSYEALDTKLAGYTKPYFIIQLCLYSEMLEAIQGALPERIHVALGDGRQESYLVKDYYQYYQHLKRDFLRHATDRPETYPEPCSHCDRCDFRTLCTDKRIADDHLSQVAKISKSQRRRLAKIGVTTVEELGACSEQRVKGIGDQTLARFQQQASLQLHKRHTGENRYLLLPASSPTKGLLALPEPDEGDLFFDIEGDPFFPEGLEYLFGVVHNHGKQEQFLDLWSHSHREEKSSFEELVRFFIQQLERFPNMHIYHYASYEETAVKRLMCKYATMEAEVDHLLRNKVFVDLYKIVGQSLLISEPSYSIKNVEHFYLPPREGEVKTAGASVVYYEKYLESKEQKFLDDIKLYNYQDCVSLVGLRDWLIKLKADADLKVTSEPEARESYSSEENPTVVKLREYEKALIAGLPDSPADYTENQRVEKLIFDLADYYRREDKPAWWKMFSRQTATTEELIDDGECIGGLVLHPTILPYPEKRSTVCTYTFPEQEYKFQVGDRGLIAESLEPSGQILELDQENCVLTLKRGNAAGKMPTSFDLIPQGPIKTEALRNSLWSFIDAYIAAKGPGDRQHTAILDLLKRRAPRIEGIKLGEPIYTAEKATIPHYLSVLQRLENSYLFIQGPPGTGKTYTASHLIVGLMQSGKKVGISANSHKVIHNLLTKVEERAEDIGFEFAGLKKASGQNPESFFNGKYIQSTDDVSLHTTQFSLFAGTAWFFAGFGGGEQLDYLFIDEAGQLSLANLIAAGTAAKNLILIGDQMQLAQPTQGIHPGESGKSVLDYLLQGRHTIPPTEGILLETTYRMHPKVCQFISEAVYDGRIKSADKLDIQTLLENGSKLGDIPLAGITCKLVEHDGSTQRSDEEADIVKSIYESLLKTRFRDREGHEHKFSPENILVVSPYNMQVNNLKRTLGDTARVGTVDKFQGQEAEVVIISMATSSPEEIPRGIDFLYSQNRLNVSLSRARICSILVMSPQLMNVRCHTVEQMKLVNTLCWANTYAEES